MTETEVLSSEDLRNRLFDTLKKRGLVDNLKTQLRNRLVAELKQMGVEGGGVMGAKERGVASLSVRAVNSLIANHLTAMNYEYSLSVFLPEANMQPNQMISAEDVLHLLQISTQSPLYKKLMDGKRGKGQDILWKLLGEVASRRLAVDCGVQTESSRVYEGSLEEELRQVDVYYSSGPGVLRGGATVEERILAYQRLLEERSSEELLQRMARFRQNELNQLKLAESEKTRKAIDKARREMEASYQVRYEALTERERHAAEQIRRLQEGADKDAHAQRQLLLEEIEAVRQREVLMRKQEETNTRERMLWEEKVRGREEAARRVEESGRRLEAEYQQRINSEVNRFKQEEQAKYLDRLRSLEYREEKVKSCESRINEEVESMSNTNKELKERRAQVLQLEGELIKMKQELLSAQKYLELNAENSREVANAQSLKESNSVLKKELDISRQQMAALTRDLLVEREKREDMLKELGHVNALPTSEKYMLQKKVELLEGTLRTERALMEHARGQTDQRHELQLTENRERLADYADDVLDWSDDVIPSDDGDVTDARGRAKRYPHKTRVRNPYDLDSATAAAAVDASLYMEGVDPRLLVESPRAPDNGYMCDSTGEFSYSSDLVRDTKKRIQRLETEAEKLEKNYQEFQFRVTSLEPVLPLSPAYMGRSGKELSGSSRSQEAARTARRLSPPPADVRQSPSQQQQQQQQQRQQRAVGTKGARAPERSADDQWRRDTGRRSEISPERYTTSESPGRSSPRREGAGGRSSPRRDSAGERGPPRREGAGGRSPLGREGAGGRSPLGREGAGGRSSPGREGAGGRSSPRREGAGGRSSPRREGAGERSSGERESSSPSPTDQHQHRQAAHTAATVASAGATKPDHTAAARGTAAAARGGAAGASSARPDAGAGDAGGEERISLDEMWRKPARQADERERVREEASPVYSSPDPDDRSILYDDESFSAKDSPKRDGRRSKQDNDSSRSESVGVASGRSSGGERKQTRVAALSPAVAAPAAVSDSRPAAAVSDSRPAAGVSDSRPAAAAAAVEDENSKIDPVMLKYMDMVKQQKEREKQQKQRSPSPSEVTESIPDQNSDNFEDDLEVEGDDRSW